MVKITEIFRTIRNPRDPKTLGVHNERLSSLIKQGGPAAIKLLKLFQAGKYEKLLWKMSDSGPNARDIVKGLFLDSPQVDVKKLILTGTQAFDEGIMLNVLEILIKMATPESIEGCISIIRQAKVDEKPVNIEHVLPFISSLREDVLGLFCSQLLSKLSEGDKYEVIAEEASKTLDHVASKIRDMEIQKKIIDSPWYFREKIQWPSILSSLAKNPAFSQNLQKELLEILLEESSEANAVHALLSRNDLLPDVYALLWDSVQDERLRCVIGLKRDLGANVSGHILVTDRRMFEINTLMRRVPRVIFEKHPLREINIGSFDINYALDPALGGTYTFESAAISIRENLEGIGFLHAFQHELMHHLSFSMFKNEDWQKFIDIGGWKLVRGDYKLEAIDFTFEMKRKLVRETWISEGPKNTLAFFSRDFDKALEEAKRYAKKLGRNIFGTPEYRFKNVFEMVAEDLVRYFFNSALFEKEASMKWRQDGYDVMLKELAFFREKMTFDINGQLTRFEFSPKGTITIPVGYTITLPS